MTFAVKRRRARSAKDGEGKLRATPERHIPRVPMVMSGFPDGGKVSAAWIWLMALPGGVDLMRGFAVFCTLIEQSKFNCWQFLKGQGHFGTALFLCTNMY